MTKANNLIWIDLEMTGLDPETDCIIEIATVVTSPQLEIVAEGPVIAIHQPNTRLAEMDEWNTKQHTKSGLVERVLSSTATTAEAETETLNFLRNWVSPGKSPMCGNSICQDRRFLARYMPTLEKYFHYRHLDVSTLKILAQLWKPKVAEHFKKTSQHLALSDIHDSIDELRHYREYLIQGD